ncbi:hypothetical protein TR51_22565 [Kitasatospora griseola]|uniref:Uncharacterized protein n=1 Tax=Kitasatospora griseola TaxID=2064 RepID=A0A0D0N1P4_KITGR|nr:hypothetical protein [Kitasatospora griseola]KIQ61995.1 hypothetical protein TR51_22565 [Kitasatospora griseola]
MSDTHYYRAEVHVRTTGGDLVTYYNDGPGPAGMSASQVRVIAEAAALAQEPGGKVEGSKVGRD